MITTIKLEKKTKNALSRLKEEKESFDDVIKKLLKRSGKDKLKENLIECYKSRDIQEFQEWEAASAEISNAE